MISFKDSEWGGGVHGVLVSVFCERLSTYISTVDYHTQITWWSLKLKLRQYPNYILCSISLTIYLLN